MTLPLRIAIADDEEEIRHYFRRLLQRLGHRVVGEAANGTELVELCRSEQPDLVITQVPPGLPDLILNEQGPKKASYDDPTTADSLNTWITATRRP